MEYTTSQLAAFAAIMSAMAAGLSAVTAVRNFRLARSIQQAAKADECIIVGQISHPALPTADHRNRLLQVPVFNKSKRKATITDLTVYDNKNRLVPVTWSDSIDNVGNPQSPANLVGVIDSATIYINRNDGERFDYARIFFAHSFSSAKQVAYFDPAADFLKSAS